MSKENIEIMRRAWDAWLRGDTDALFELWDTDVVWDLTHFREWPDNRHEGREDVKRFLKEWLDVWADYEVGVDARLEAPDGRVVTLAWQSGRGNRSGLQMRMEWAEIATIRNGKVTLLEQYDDRPKALEAAGLSE
jgi:ketosteroid isomerase-like protein